MVRCAGVRVPRHTTAANEDFTHIDAGVSIEVEEAGVVSLTEFLRFGRHMRRNHYVRLCCAIAPSIHRRAKALGSIIGFYFASQCVALPQNIEECNKGGSLSRPAIL